MTVQVNNEKDFIKIALKLLASRDYFSSELKNKVIAKGAPDDIADKVMEYLANYNYLDDRRVLEKYSKEIAQKLKGFFYLKKKLYEKGCFDILEKMDMRCCYTEEMEKEAALNLVDKLNLSDMAVIEKKLVSRGFSSEIIPFVKREIKNRAKWN